jgi:hypothetical protein
MEEEMCFNPLHRVLGLPSAVALILWFAGVCAPELCAQGVIINEVMFFPDTSDTVHERNHQWVELYNQGGGINLDGWVISNGDASPDAVLPAWDFPASTYLVVHFTTGTDDDDFSDGAGHYYAGAGDVFSEAMDECALYDGTPSGSTIRDFMNWSVSASYSPGQAHDYAVPAGIWIDGDFFTPVNSENQHSKLVWVTPGESMGRDSSSAETNIPEDWATLGGANAIYASPGEVNYQLLEITNAKGKGIKVEWKSWLVIYYMSHDNNLEKFGFKTLDALERQGPLPNVNVVVQVDFDSVKDGKSYRFFIQEQDTQKGKINSPGYEIPECNMGDAGTLHDFIYWAVDTFPHYQCVVWIDDHGAGWKGVSQDKSSANDYLCMQELYQGLNLPYSPKLDVVVFDACLMGMVEVAYQIKDRVDMMVGSEEIVYCGDFPYTSIFATMDDNPSWFDFQLAVDIVGKAAAQAQRHKHDTYTFSAIDCRQLEPLIEQIDDFGFELDRGLEDYDYHFLTHDDPNDNVQIHIRNQLVQAEHFDDANFIDLYHFAYLIENDADIPPDYKTQAQPIMQSLQKGGDLIKAEEHGNAHPEAHGLSIYFPTAQTKGGSWNPPDPPVIKHDAACSLKTAPGVWTHYANCEEPYDRPGPSQLPNNGGTAKYAFDPDDCNPPYQNCVNNFDQAKNHPHPPTPGFFFVQETMWDNFLHRYYEPVADAGEDKQAKVGQSVTLSGSGSSDADGFVRHWYWDFDSRSDAPPDCPPGEEDWDRDCQDDVDDDKTGVDAVAVDFPCNSPGAFPITLNVWDDHNEQGGTHTDHFETDEDQVLVRCIDTVFTFEPPPDESRHENGTFESDTFYVSDGTGHNVISVDAVFTGTGIGIIEIVYTIPPPSLYLEGYVQYEVDDHCLEGGGVMMTAINDAEETLTGEFAITLTNTTPTITCPPDESFDYTDGYSGEASAFDEDGDPFYFFKMDGPDALVVNEDGTILWETVLDDVGGPYNVIVGIGDACDAEAACEFSLTVTAPVGCCQHEDYCEMLTEMECMELTGTIWYPPPYRCVDEISCQMPCGDFNLDDIIDLSDAVSGLNYLFRGYPPPEPLCLMDVTCDGEVNVNDVIYLLNYLFRGGDPPSPACCDVDGKLGVSPEQGIRIAPDKD